MGNKTVSLIDRPVKAINKRSTPIPVPVVGGIPYSRAARKSSSSAIASSSLVTEWVKGKTVDEAMKLKNTQIVEELNLPPVKIHCSVLAEDAIKSAIADFRKKQSERRAVAAEEK